MISLVDWRSNRRRANFDPSTLTFHGWSNITPRSMNTAGGVCLLGLFRRFAVFNTKEGLKFLARGGVFSIDSVESCTKASKGCRSNITFKFQDGSEIVVAYWTFQDPIWSIYGDEGSAESFFDMVLTLCNDPIHRRNVLSMWQRFT